MVENLQESLGFLKNLQIWPRIEWFYWINDRESAIICALFFAFHTKTGGGPCSPHKNKQTKRRDKILPKMVPEPKNIWKIPVQKYLSLFYANGTLLIAAQKKTNQFSKCDVETFQYKSAILSLGEICEISPVLPQSTAEETGRAECGTSIFF